MIPFRIGLKVPASLVKSERLHRRMIRESLKEVAEVHWKEHIPKHFEPAAAAKYGYAPRAKKYKRDKLRKYGSTTDLIKTGGTKRLMTREKTITISGAGDKATARLTMRFPFPGGTGRFRKHGSHQRVTMQQMQSEIAKTLVYEQRTLADELKSRYLARVKTLSKRQLKVK